MSETKTASFSAKDIQEKQLNKLRSLLSLPIEERNTLLTQNSAILAKILPLALRKWNG